jgi:hypothetical protein
MHYETYTFKKDGGVYYEVTYRVYERNDYYVYEKIYGSEKRKLEAVAEVPQK